MKTNRSLFTDTSPWTSREQYSLVRKRCRERPGRKALGQAGSERVSGVSFLPASESLSGGAGTAACYPTLQKTLQWGGRSVESLPFNYSAARASCRPCWSQRKALARAPRLGLAGLVEVWFQEGQAAWPAGVLALQPGLGSQHS